MKRYEIENTFSGHMLGIFGGETPEQAIRAMLTDAGCGPDEEADPELKAREVDDYDPEADAELEAERDAGIAPEDRDETKPSRLMIRTLFRCPNTPSEWQWTEAVDADAPDGASVEDYVEVHNDSTDETHVGVYLVGRLNEIERHSLGIEDIRGRIHRQVGSLVAWVLRDGTVAYELVSEE